MNNRYMLLADLDLNAVYSYADYLTWGFDDRVELINGKIFEMGSAPGTNHQIVSGRLFNQIMNFLKGHECHVFSAPFDVRLAKKSTNNKDVLTVVQPDICVICDRSKIDEKGCIGAPDIIIEILSPANNKKELRNKYEIYEQSGVKEYWIVSPQDHTALIYTLRDSKFVPSRLMADEDIITSEVLPGLSIDLAELFSRLF